MQVTTDNIDTTNVKLTITGEAKELDVIKVHVLKELGQRSGTIPGFRKGKVPVAVLEKNLDPALVQGEFLEHAVNDLFIKAVDAEKLRTVSQPKIEVTKFVAYDTIEFTAEIEVIGEIKLPDYKKLKIEKQKVTVAAKDIDAVLKQLQERDAERKEVARAAKDGDQVLIDFKGVDTKTKDAIAGADGKDYPLTLGSKSFIPGFEEELIGLKAGDEKTFDITFPKDYGAKVLQSKKVTFTVTVHTVSELVDAKIDDDFAKKIGPFETLDDLKADIKKQLLSEREGETERAYENDLIEAIAKDAKVEIPAKVIDDQLDRMEAEEKQNLMYRGQTWEEHLKEDGVTAEEHREKNREGATLRVKAGLVLSEIAEAEQLTVETEELEFQISLLKQQYPDEKMRAELDKPENRRDIMSRILTQKTMTKLKEYQTA